MPTGYTPQSTTRKSYSPVKGLLDQFPVKYGAGTMITGQADVSVAGSVLGQITASKKWTLCDKDAVDGSAKPRAILTATVDAQSGDTGITFIKTGSWNKDNLVFAAGTVLADVEVAMEDVNLYPIEILEA